MIDVSSGIKKYLQEKGKTQKDLSKETGISETSISLIMNGRTSPKKNTLESISSALDTTPELIVLESMSEKDVFENESKYYKISWVDNSD